MICTFPHNLQMFREKKNLTRAAVAAKIGKSPQVYGQYELGTREPSLQVLINIAEILETTPNKLLGFDAEYNFKVDMSDKFERIRQAMQLADIQIEKDKNDSSVIRFYRKGQPFPQSGSTKDWNTESWGRLYLMVNRIIEEVQQKSDKIIAERINLLYDLDLFNKTDSPDKWLINSYLYDYDFLFTWEPNHYFQEHMDEIVAGKIENPFNASLRTEFMELWELYQCLRFNHGTNEQMRTARKRLSQILMNKGH